MVEKFVPRSKFQEKGRKNSKSEAKKIDKALRKFEKKLR